VIRNAAFNGYVDVVRMLLEWTGPNGERVDPTADSNSPLESAAQEGHVDVVQLLLNDSRVEPNTNDNYALKSAARNGHVDVVQLLLNDSRVDPTAEKNFAIRIAAVRGHLAIVRFLLDWRGANGEFVDPTVDNDNAIVSAAKEGQVDVVRVLIQWRGPNDEKIYMTRQRLRKAFTLAIRNDHPDVAVVLVEWNGEKTFPVVFLDDILNIVARKGFDDVLQAFLQQENYKRELWPMVYYAAVKYNRLEVLRPTLENLDSLTKNGMIEMLRGAAETGQEQLVRDLLVPNLIAKLDDIEQLYPSFSGAAASGNPRIVRMFLSVILSNGQRIDPSNDQNEALDNATERGHYEVVQLLLRQPRVADRVNQSYTIMAAANSGNLQLFDYLLNRYPNGIQRNEIRELLNRAIASDNPEILLRVLQIPTFDNLPFDIDMSSIVRTGNVEMMKVIVENNITDRADISDTVTAFVKKNNVEILEYLISEKVLLPNRLIYNYGWLQYENPENTKLQVMLLDYIVKQTGIVDENGRLAKYPMFY